MRILVCGGRDFTDKNILYAALDRLLDLPASGLRILHTDMIIAGAARGADTLAADYAKHRGLRLKEYPADWKKHGKRAGYLRNKQMLDEAQPHKVLAFPGGKGTQMMIDLALKAGVPVIQVGRDPLGNIVMGTLGSSSQTTSANPGIRTKLFQQKYIDRIAAFQMLTPGQRDGIYQEVAREEENYFKNLDAAALEYEEIQKAQEIMENFKDAD